MRLQKQPDAWPEGVPLPLTFPCLATKVFCHPWYWNRGPGWLSSQGVAFAVRRDQNLSPNQQLSEGATPDKPDAWPEGVPLPLAFDCYATNEAFPSTEKRKRVPGWLSSQGVLQLRSSVMRGD